MDWEQRYTENETPWDKGAPAPPLAEWLESNSDTISGEVVVPGCGRGHDNRLLASMTNAQLILGLDLSPTAVASAREHMRSPAEAYEVADWFALDADHTNRFDWLWEHTCFCAIPPTQRQSYVEVVARILKPGGKLLGVFFIDPYDETHLPDSGSPPYGTPVEELETRFVSSGHFRELSSSIPSRAYPGREGRERLVLYERI